MSLKQQLIQRMKNNADAALQQRDAEHINWIHTNDGLAEVIKFPTLGIVPSERTGEQSRAILIHNIKNWRKQ